MHGHESHEHDHGSHNQGHLAELPRETEGLPEARKTELVELADGDKFELEIKPVKKRIGDGMVRMLTYNGSVPGPTLKVLQGATITVHVTNHGDLDATVHWHGLRLENRYDGTHETQAPIPVGETFIPGARARPRRLLVPPTYPMRNLRAQPALQIQIGRETYVPEQHFLSEDEAVAVALEFRRRHPHRLRLFATILGWGDLSSEAAVREFVRSRPFVSFLPAHPTRP